MPIVSSGQTLNVAEARTLTMQWKQVHFMRAIDGCSWLDDSFMLGVAWLAVGLSTTHLTLPEVCP
jgi:hypothetical protein